MVTKQQQLEWLASKIVKWPADGAKIPVSIDDAGNPKFYMPWDAFSPWDVMRVDFTREEWQTEREKMQKQEELNIQGRLGDSAFAAQPTPDNSWHERGELPPVGCVVDVTGDNVAYGCGESKCEVLAHVEDCAVIRMSFGLGCFVAEVLSPSHTEREKAIDEMIAVISSMSILSVESIAEKLYDAGCRMEKPQ